MLEHIETEFRGSVEFDVLRSSKMQSLSWIQQFWLFTITDIVIGPHGAAFGWVWALPRGSAVVELLPFEAPIWSPCSGRWGQWDDEMHAGSTHAGFARLSGVHHKCVKAPHPA